MTRLYDPVKTENPFVAYRNEFESEIDQFYSTYPVDVSNAESVLEARRRRLIPVDEFTEKSLIYSVAAELCDVHVFSYFPFYFEIESGRERHSWGGDGLGRWFRDHHFPEISDQAEYIRDTFSGYYSLNGVTAGVLDFDHHSIDYDSVLEKGLTGIRREVKDAAERADDERTTLLYESMIAGIDALTALSRRFSRKADELLQSAEDPVVRRNLERLSASAAVCPAEPPETFYQALNTLIFMRELIGSLEGIQVSTFGHMDRMLYPFYQRDIREGRISEADARELLSSFLLYTEIKFECRKERHETSTTVVLGGCEPDGTPVFNDVTRVILELYSELQLMEPKLHVRLSRSHPEELKMHCASLTAKNLNVLAIYNDEVVIEAVSKAGRAVEDARLYIGGGCQENKLQNCEVNSRATLYMNVPKLFESIFAPESVKTIVEREHVALLSSGNINSFGDLYDALLFNARAISKALVYRRNTSEKKGSQINPCPLLSAVTGDCISRGLDIFEGGARYSAASIGLTGMATYIDSLLAIKHIVYDEGKMPLDAFMAIVSHDFADNEELRLYIRSRLPKYGSGDCEARALGRRVFSDMSNAVSGFPNGRGGRYEPSLFSHTNYMGLGRLTAATADGRHSGDHLSKGIGPSFISLGSQWHTGQIIDTLGDIDLTAYPVIGVLDLKLPRLPEDSESQLITPIIDRFLANNGSVLQINCVDTDMLMEARERPDLHPNLIVRVSGFSANFTTLPSDVQDEIISRSSCVG